MDRRRFVPAPEGLEVRTMLATTTGSGFSLFGNSSNTTQSLPITFAQKELRIQKMPTNLRALQPDRTLPPITINQIQLGLNEIMSQTLSTPRNDPGLTNYNLEMRNIVHNTSLSAAAVHTLNHMFGSIMNSVDTPNPGLTNVVSGVNQLVSQVDTASISPVFLATNDNAYILQLALVLGPQMPAPRAPTITKGTGHQNTPGVAITPLYAPTYVGSYEYGTTIDMVNVTTGQVIGTAVVAKNGQLRACTSPRRWPSASTTWRSEPSMKSATSATPAASSASRSSRPGDIPCDPGLAVDCASCFQSLPVGLLQITNVVHFERSLSRVAPT